MAITKQEMLDKIAASETKVVAALATTLSDGDIDDDETEVKLWGQLNALAITQPLVKKYIEDNY